MPSQTLVIGAGIAGLIAAHDLAAAGACVTVLEGSARPGGRAQTRREGGYAINQGPHALYLGGAFRKALDRIGVAYAGEPREIQRKALRGGKLHTLPVGATSLMTTSLFDVADKAGFAGIMAKLKDAGPPVGSFAGWADGQRLRPRVREALSALLRLSSYAHAEDEVPAAEAIAQIRLALGGTLYVNDGWQTLVDGLLEKAEAAGATIRSSAVATTLTRSASGWSVGLGSGETLQAAGVVLACPPDVAASLIGEPGRFANLRACRANTLDLALSHRPEGSHDFVLGIDRPLYASVHSATARLTPTGGVLVHFARYLAPDEAPGLDAAEELEALADLTLPGWRKHVVRRQRLIAMPVVHALPTLAVPRPDVDVPGMPGVCLAGDWVGREAMLSDTAAASAAIAARSLLNFLG